MSDEYLWRPVTNSRPSTLGTEVPAIFHSPAGVTRVELSTVLVNFWPLVSWPKVTDSPPGLEILPSATVREERSALKYSAAISSNTPRAAAAAVCRRGAICGVVMLPKVPMSKGTRSVSAITILMEETGARSSSATAWVKEVRMFCPTSVLPVKTVTVPSSPMWIQALISAGRPLRHRAPPRPRTPPSWATAAGTRKRTMTPEPSVLKKSRRVTSKGAGASASRL